MFPSSASWSQETREETLKSAQGPEAPSARRGVVPERENERLGLQNRVSLAPPLLPQRLSFLVFAFHRMFPVPHIDSSFDR